MVDLEECLVCFDETNQFQVFLCGHKVCVQCYPRLRSNKCPVCNQPIQILQTYSTVHMKCGVLIMICVIIICMYVMLKIN